MDSPRPDRPAHLDAAALDAQSRVLPSRSPHLALGTPKRDDEAAPASPPNPFGARASPVAGSPAASGISRGGGLSALQHRCQALLLKAVSQPEADSKEEETQIARVAIGCKTLVNLRESLHPLLRSRFGQPAQALDQSTQLHWHDFRRGRVVGRRGEALAVFPFDSTANFHHAMSATVALLKRDVLPRTAAVVVTDVDAYATSRRTSGPALVASGGASVGNTGQTIVQPHKFVLLVDRSRLEGMLAPRQPFLSRRGDVELEFGAVVREAFCATFCDSLEAQVLSAVGGSVRVAPRGGSAASPPGCTSAHRRTSSA